MSNEGSGEDLQIRFRHSSGTDIGPFSFEDGNTIQSVKSVVFQRWPTGERKPHPGPTCSTNSYLPQFFTAPLIQLQTAPWPRSAPRQQQT
jgi:hypothetical protein